ncbi:MerR family transcriptional regulator [Plantactinospora sp. BC1]|uniref:DNA polymerase III subunit beta family protein n=1 Tax=Plantactinospora sp. BC1 TaxID=2108470 RepID=UPI000D16F1BB|nr:MerR family transcriptional regulator [Plantactinospora sp. BC1]AVT33625.1 MerR family transcriptional regulator [Plantactinospora sp. BC1]
MNRSGRLLGIGEMARASGLSISALRFYDGAGVLPPASVDPGSGYRRYAERQLPAARLLAGLRRIGMPLAEITRVLELRGSDPAAVSRLLDAHLHRLEEGLADARREAARLRVLCTAAEPEVRLTVPGGKLAAAVDAVRFAVGADPGLPMLGGVHFELDRDVLRLVATDRYRMAVSEVVADTGPHDAAEVVADTGPHDAGAGGAASRLGVSRLTAPVSFVDAARALLTGGWPATLTLGPAAVSLRVRDRRVTGTPMEHDFPDYRRLLRAATGGPERRRVTVDVAGLRERLTTGETRTVVRPDDGTRCAVSVLAVDAADRLTVSAADAPPADPVVRVGVDREFLLDALDAAGPGQGQLVLELDGPIRPLAVRRPDDDRAFSILMPVRI